MLALLPVLLSGCGREKVSTDLSEVETAFSPVWSVDRTERIVRADGTMGPLEISDWLCRYNFERGEVETVAAPADNLELMPSDTPLGTAIMLWEDVEIVYAFNDRALLVTDGGRRNTRCNGWISPRVSCKRSRMKRAAALRCACLTIGGNPPAYSFLPTTSMFFMPRWNL